MQHPCRPGRRPPATGEAPHPCTHAIGRAGSSTTTSSASASTSTSTGTAIDTTSTSSRSSTITTSTRSTSGSPASPTARLPADLRLIARPITRPTAHAPCHPARGRLRRAQHAGGRQINQGPIMINH